MFTLHCVACVCLTSDSCSRVSVYVQSARVQRSLCLWYLSFCAVVDSVCDTMSMRDFARTPSFRDGPLDHLRKTASMSSPIHSREST